MFFYMGKVPVFTSLESDKEKGSPRLPVFPLRMASLGGDVRATRFFHLFKIITANHESLPATTTHRRRRAAATHR